VSSIGIVAIGRNEAENLDRCLRAAIAQSPLVVYVDSGSTDASVEIAHSVGVEVVELDPAEPFTAARGRNQGWAYLLQKWGTLDYVQFVDGDCELSAGWCDRAQQVLDQQPDLAVVWGLLQERFPERSIYNQLCDLEWQGPLGETEACGGIAMIRVSALQQVGGYNSHLSAGEEPELCLRLRRQQWRILRIEAKMAEHDAQMYHFHQWWRRAVRAGHAYAEGAWLQGHESERHWVRESLRSWLWGLCLPLATVSLSPPTHGWSLVFLLGYPLLAWRIFSAKATEAGSRAAALYALFCILAKFPELQGQLAFHLTRFHRQPDIS
jgi:glycosyltransferase involved in cell wall biosynthesis